MKCIIVTSKSYFTHKCAGLISIARYDKPENDIILAHIMWFRIDLARGISRMLPMEYP